MYRSLQECIADLDQKGQLIRITEEVDPYLVMAAVQRKIYAQQGKAVYFEKVKGSRYPAVCNIFGTLNRCKGLFQDSIPHTLSVIALKQNPAIFFKKPFHYFKSLFAAIHALPLRKKNMGDVFEEITIADIPQIVSWEKDGGAFITLPQVYSEDPENPGIMHSNLGMYRIQLSGNEYITNKEIGLHYQIHRGIGVHQSKAIQQNKPLKVSIFVGGPPADTIAAVMPLPEGLSELSFAGLLGNRRFRYTYEDGFAISLDADFIITGELFPHATKPEGPFGDHLGYYSLQHDFPVLNVHKVYAKKNAIWPFTVVGRPPQEDSTFGAFIHALTGTAIPNEIPGIKEVHAVDAAGVHPLLLAVGSERYTPYAAQKEPAELLTQANRILGTGQLSLAKYLFIAADDERQVKASDTAAFLQFVLERVHFNRDIHFQTATTMDTLDYSGSKLNHGSKVVIAAYGEKIRDLTVVVPEKCMYKNDLSASQLIIPGIIAVQGNPYVDERTAKVDLAKWEKYLQENLPPNHGIALIVLCDDATFVSANLDNFLWVTFTRSNPANDIYGLNEMIKNKHWACDAPMIIDARIKPHHAPALIENEAAEKEAERILAKYA